jgi:hypothetical protein
MSMFPRPDFGFSTIKSVECSFPTTLLCGGPGGGQPDRVRCDAARARAGRRNFGRLGPAPAGVARQGGIEHKHSTDVESPSSSQEYDRVLLLLLLHTPRVCMMENESSSSVSSARLYDGV